MLKGFSLLIFSYPLYMPALRSGIVTSLRHWIQESKQSLWRMARASEISQQGKKMPTVKEGVTGVWAPRLSGRGENQLPQLIIYTCTLWHTQRHMHAVIHARCGTRRDTCTLWYMHAVAHAETHARSETYTYSYTIHLLPPPLSERQPAK